MRRNSQKINEYFLNQGYILLRYGTKRALRMWFFSKEKKEKKAAPQRPSIARKALRVAFNPEIGATISPVQESVDMFVNLLAMIFAAQGMFPRNHPIFLGRADARLSLGALLSTVWRDLKFSKETVPQV